MKRNVFSSDQRQLSVCLPSLILLLTIWVSHSSAANETVSRGAAVAYACMICHGPDGQSTGAIPSLKAMPAQTLRETMLAYRNGERSGTVMNRLARGLDDADIEAVATYFSTRR